ncbi:MAG: hypothetical protein K5686_00830 [Lachnospiraceae bacterium]|nr:hypothetical protein [Lachnospiraceae bacterium]
MKKNDNDLQDTLNLINLDETGVLPVDDPVFQGEVSVDTMLLTDISKSVAEIDMYDDAAYTGEPQKTETLQQEDTPDASAEGAGAETATLEMIDLDTSTLNIPTVEFDEEELSVIGEADTDERDSNIENPDMAEPEITEEFSGDDDEAFAEESAEAEEEIPELPGDATSDISGEELIDIEKILSRRKKSGKKKKPEAAAPAAVRNSKSGGGRDGGGKSSAGKKQKKKTPVDRKKLFGILVAVAAVFVIIAAVMVLLQKKPAAEGEKPDMYAAGQGLREIGIAGEGVLVALADAELAAQVADKEGQPENTVPAEDDRRVDVIFTSVEQDLKIKFVDSNSRRLVGGTEFEVKLVSTSGKPDLEFADDDKDGIIYKTGLAAGDYRVEIADKEGITIGSTSSTVTIKEHIEYKKIDIVEEVKTEKEVNVAVEDTAGGNEEAEGGAEPEPEVSDQDTVEWVESTRTEVEGSGGYEKVEREKITEPAYVSRTEVDLRYRAGAAQDEVVTYPLETPTPEPDTGDPVVVEDGPTPTESPEDTPTPTPDPDATPTPTPTPTPSDKVTGTPTPAPTENGTPTPEDEDKKDKDPSKDKKTKLKDKDGRQLYVKEEDGKYREAVYADYYKDVELYVHNEPEYVYTGWQTINGNTYFFDKNGKKVTGEQVIQGVKYEFNAEGILIQDKNGILGIDVSKWNGSINWSEVKNSGINYVIIRCGYRGSSTGVLVEDSLFKSNIQGAKAAGLKVGVYFFTQAVNEVEAVEEASMCLELAGKYGLSYPVFLDVEYTTGKNGRADSLDKAARTAVTKAFCETIKNGGMTPGVYSSKTWFDDKLDYGALSGYKIWVAHYTSKTDFAKRYDLWQYSSKGGVSGIEGKVDMNYSYLGY